MFAWLRKRRTRLRSVSTGIAKLTPLPLPCIDSKLYGLFTSTKLPSRSSKPVLVAHHCTSALNAYRVFMNLTRFAAWTYLQQCRQVKLKRRYVEDYTIDLLLLNVAVLIPTKRPLESSRGPPEFPLLMEASVCIFQAHICRPSWRADH